MKVRRATMDDLFPLVELGAQFHAESSYKNTEFDPIVFAEFLQKALSGGDFFAVVMEKSGAIVGTMIGMVAPFFFSKQIRATDIMLYVLPSFRGGSGAFQMEKLFTSWASGHGAVVPKILGVSTGIKLEKTHAFYGRMGYSCIGYIFAKEL